MSVERLRELERQHPLEQHVVHLVGRRLEALRHAADGARRDDGHEEEGVQHRLHDGQLPALPVLQPLLVEEDADGLAGARLVLRELGARGDELGRFLLRLVLAVAVGQAQIRQRPLALLGERLALGGCLCPMPWLLGESSTNWRACDGVTAEGASSLDHHIEKSLFPC